jgi:DNA-binding GntR family transcriptional regulator
MSAVLSEQIAEALQQAILRGDYAPGEPIRQDAVAIDWKTSRFPVREAFRILEARGLVTVEAKKGARVTALSQAECIELYRMREHLEPLLIGDSVERLQEHQVEQLDEILGALGADDLSVDEYLELDRSFHQLTYAGSDLRTVAALVDQLVQTTQHYRRAYFNIVHASGGRSWILQYDHRLILDAIRRKDSEEAADIMRLHTRRARQALEQHPDLFPSTGRRREKPRTHA